MHALRGFTMGHTYLYSDLHIINWHYEQQLLHYEVIYSVDLLILLIQTN